MKVTASGPTEPQLPAESKLERFVHEEADVHGTAGAAGPGSCERSAPGHPPLRLEELAVLRPCAADPRLAGPDRAQPPEKLPAALQARAGRRGNPPRA